MASTSMTHIRSVLLCVSIMAVVVGCTSRSASDMPNDSRHGVPTTAATSVVTSITSDQSAALQRARSIRTLILSGHFACVDEPAVPDDSSMDVSFGSLVILDCPQANGHVIELNVFKDRESKEDAIRSLSDIRCGLRQPPYYYVDGSNWVLQSFISANSATSREDASRLAPVTNGAASVIGCH